MSIDYLKDIAKDLVREISPSLQNYLTYFFIFVGIVWCGNAINYYFTEESIKFKGSLLTGVIFFTLSGIAALWEYYRQEYYRLEKKVGDNNNMTDMIIKVAPVALPMLYNIARKVRLPSLSSKSIAVIGLIGGAALYYKYRSRNNRF